MKFSKSTSICVAAAALGLAACTTSPPYRDTPGQYPPTSQYPSQYPSTAQYPTSPDYRGYGYVESVEVVPGDTRSGPGIGAIGGAIAGGVLGNQVGHGTGRAAATIGGAVAGGVIGNEVEKRVDRGQPTMYRFRVRMDDGSYQTFTQGDHLNLRVGDRVRVENGHVSPS